jgi:hypothetical protein
MAVEQGRERGGVAKQVAIRPTCRLFFRGDLAFRYVQHVVENQRAFLQLPQLSPVFARMTGVVLSGECFRERAFA